MFLHVRLPSRLCKYTVQRLYMFFLISWPRPVESGLECRHNVCHAASAFDQTFVLIHLAPAIRSNRLTGLLSFMLSNEMTTGSVTSTDAEKRLYASRSHAWNLQQKRFKEAFPEVS